MRSRNFPVLNVHSRCSAPFIMSALTAHAHLLTAIKVQVLHAVEALEAKVSNWLTCQFTTQNMAIMQAVQDARSSADESVLLLGLVADLRVKLDRVDEQLTIERTKRREMMRAFEARLQLLEADLATRQS